MNSVILRIVLLPSITPLSFVQYLTAAILTKLYPDSDEMKKEVLAAKIEVKTEGEACNINGYETNLWVAKV